MWGSFVEKGGWTTLPGSDTANSAVAQACATMWGLHFERNRNAPTQALVWVHPDEERFAAAQSSASPLPFG
jgi:hypothetical protein